MTEPMQPTNELPPDVKERFEDMTWEEELKNDVANLHVVSGFLEGLAYELDERRKDIALKFASSLTNIAQNRLQELAKATAEAVKQNKKVIEWCLSDDTGVSSKSICSFMLGLPSESNFSAPIDSADRGRCIRLLNLVPEWWNRLDEMASLPSREVTVYTKNGFEVRKEGWAKQIPLIRTEALSNSTEEKEDYA